MKDTKSNDDFAGGFDPQMLIEDARAQAPEFAWLPTELMRCGAGNWESSAYVHYVSSTNPNQPGSEWQFKTNVVIDHSTLGTVVIDVLHGDRIGGIEFIDRINR